MCVCVCVCVCGTGMKTTLTLESLASQRDLRFVDSLVPGGDWSGERNIYFKKRKKWVVSKEAVKIPQDVLNSILGHKYH